MESTLKNMVLVLFSVTLITSAVVGVVYKYTQDPIEKAKQEKIRSSLTVILPQFDNNPAKDMQTVMADGTQEKIYTAKQADKVVGYAVETSSREGYGGEIVLMVGFTPTGEIINIAVLSHNETPGLGAKMTDAGNSLIVSLQGKNPSQIVMKVRKDGGDVDALTAATISSRAYTSAVERAYRVLRENVSLSGADSASGATALQKDSTSGATQADTDAASGATVQSGDSITTDAASGATSKPEDGQPAAEKTNNK